MKRQTTQEPKNSSRLSHHLFLSVSLPEGTMGCSAAIRATTPERWTSRAGFAGRNGVVEAGF